MGKPVFGTARCQYCGKEVDVRGLKNHERICDQNPNRQQGRPGSGSRSDEWWAGYRAGFEAAQKG